MSFEHILQSFAKEALLNVITSTELASKVDEKAEELSKKNPAYLYRKQPSPVQISFPAGLLTNSASVLHELGLATTFFTRSPFADIAHHWANVRYCGTLTATRKGMLALSRDGNERVVHHHKTAQSEHLGIGLALIVAKEVLRRTDKGWEFTAVDADVALKAGSIDGVGPVRQLEATKNRPDYFLIGRRRDGRSQQMKVVVLECKGTHEKHDRVLRQLAKACVQLQTVEVGNGVPPGLMIASSLSPEGITAHVLDPPGDENVWSGSQEQLDELLAEDPGESILQIREVTSGQAMDVEQRADVDRKHALIEHEGLSVIASETSADDDFRGPIEVVHIPEERRTWFMRVLARTAAASALLFAGDKSVATGYTTRRQRGAPSPDELPYEGLVYDGSASTPHAHHRLLDTNFTGAEYVMPLPDGRRLEVFRGLETQLYDLLADGKVGPYYRKASSKHKEWLGRSRRSRGSQNDVLSMQPNGTVLRMRIV
ncbi:hypothetical protein NE235_02400 [Actinoallomurus spadix]|uniref:Uncharacterized protein n=1 Tax=Actinoallomurus spadix TaxID=79912 RepID=A0ABN0XJK0_9ACTN|nr:hypothetical protein [Actinoallomurus spadix]MCO5984952.1 hypothetical protein [Actinoallomurus spadix]